MSGRLDPIVHNGEVRTPVIVHCKVDSRGFTWTPGYLPCTVDMLSKWAKTFCLMCGARGGLMGPGRLDTDSPEGQSE